MIVLLAGAVVVLLTAGAMPVHTVNPLRRNCQMLWVHANNAAHGVGGITRMEQVIYEWIKSQYPLGFTFNKLDVVNGGCKALLGQGTCMVAFCSI